jgi:hypothetical protein
LISRATDADHGRAAGLVEMFIDVAVAVVVGIVTGFALGDAAWLR